MRGAGPRTLKPAATEDGPVRGGHRHQHQGLGGLGEVHIQHRGSTGCNTSPEWTLARAAGSRRPQTPGVMPHTGGHVFGAGNVLALPTLRLSMHR